jgi:hypothetical protein
MFQDFPTAYEWQMLNRADDPNMGAGMLGYGAAISYPSGTVGEQLRRAIAYIPSTATGADIQAALDTASAAGGGAVYLGPYTYDLSTVGLTVYQNVALIGVTDAYVASTTRGTRLIYSGSGNAIYGTQLLNTRIENIQLDCRTSTGSSVKGIYFEGVWRSVLHNVTVKGVYLYRGEGIYFDTKGGAWGSQHNLIENCECSDGRVRFIGTSPSDGVTTTVVNTFRGFLYANFHSQITYINATAESPASTYNGGTAYTPNQWVISGGNLYVCIANTTGNAPPNASYWLAITGAGFYLDGAGCQTALISCDIEGNFPVGVSINNSAPVTIVNPLWAGFTGTTRVSGDSAVLVSYGGARILTSTLSNGSLKTAEGYGDQNATYVTEALYPVNVAGGAQDGYMVRKRLIAGTEYLTHEQRDHFEFHHTKSIANSATTVLTIPIPSDTAIYVDCFVYGNDGAGTAYGVSQLAVSKNDSGTVTVSTQTAVKEAAGYTGAFTFSPSATNLLVQFATANATPSTCNFLFRIRGPIVGYTLG